jgi:hypothetical protein
VGKEQLYSGADLESAAANSHLARKLGDRVLGIRNAALVMYDMVARRSTARSSRYELVVASGETPGGHRLTVAYAGPGANREWCFATVFASHSLQTLSTSQTAADLRRWIMHRREDADILFGDGVPARLFFGMPFVSLPAWVKQRVPVLDDWPAQVEGMRRNTRQELRRFLRKYRYECSLSSALEDASDFYGRLYRPYVTQRFGAAALVVDRSTFLRECRRGILIRLWSNGTLLGGAVLRPVGRALAVVWSALDAATPASSLRGVTDCLDYFSLLYAHLQGYRCLDLGPSRPDLRDGILRYKAKWGGEISAGFASQALIHLSCRANGQALQDFLGRHVFVIREANGLRAVEPQSMSLMLADDSPVYGPHRDASCSKRGNSAIRSS